jgi:hypothetical protein
VENVYQHKGRPFGVYLIIVLLLVMAVFLALALLGEKTIAKYLRILIQNPIFYSWFGWVLIGSEVVAALGLWLLKRWGWILTMILTGAGLAFSIWTYFHGNPKYFPMAVYVAIAFYLNQRDVQAPFKRSYSPGGAQ